MNKIKRYGWRRDKLDSRDHLFAIARPAPIPNALDWTDKLPPCYDQGDLGSCTANAIAGALEFLQGKQGELLVMPSRLFIYYNERLMEGTEDSDSGAEIRDGIKSVNRQGACPEKDWPYDIARFADRPPANCYVEGLTEQLLQYQRVDNTHLNSLLTALTLGPVVGGFTVFASFESEEVAKTGVVPMPEPGEEIMGGHAVLVTGYDQSIKRFKGRNSWSPSWGDNGSFTIPFDCFTNGRLASDFWLCRKVE